MKIVQFITRMDVIGGAQKHVLELSKGLSKKDNEVFVISKGHSALTEELEYNGIPYYTMKHLQVPIHPFKDLMAFMEMYKLLKKIQPDLIAIHSSKAGIIGRLLGSILQIPTVFTAHSWSFAGTTNKFKKYFYIGVEWMISRLKSSVISVSHYDEKLAQQYINSPTTRRKVIHNGIRNQPVYQTYMKRQQTIQLIMIARFAKPKDHALLLNALDYLPYKNWHLTLVGDGPLRKQAEQKAQDLHLTKHITFSGEISNIDTLLNQADIFLLISNSEGLPISIIEAMRAQLAIIASNVGGINELIDHRHNGLLVTPSEREALTNAILELIEDPLKRATFAYQARNKYEQQFTFEKMFQQTVSLYQQTISKSYRQRKVVV